MAHVDRVAAIQLRSPVALLVLIKPDYVTLRMTLHLPAVRGTAVYAAGSERRLLLDLQSRVRWNHPLRAPQPPLVIRSRPHLNWSLSLSHSKRLPVAAISFLNPAPLMWDFEHPPRNAELAPRYDIHYTQPSQCAAELEQGRAGLGLIPIAALTPQLAIVPGCTIASLDRVRSIQLIVKRSLLPAASAQADDTDQHTVDLALRALATVAADTASRSSLAYAQVLFRRFLGSSPAFVPAPADVLSMLRHADAALVIGDPALLALEYREAIESQPGIGPCLWIDIAHQWCTRTGLPWVAAVWAARPESLASAALSPAALTQDLQRSRDNGLAHIPELVEQWSPRLPLPAKTVREYLTRNIHYTLTPECIETIRQFRAYAAEADVLPPLRSLRFL
jgi:chorismate dehydratase